ncbi:hypothetical protein ACFV2Z_12950 [Streptomyces sp. NPDC059688]|uniref:hypothetical protein n=1 Tax=Streptomyces sp. NPDC059688 TaxID=3346906 RepID=UPI0036ABF2F3
MVEDAVQGRQSLGFAFLSQHALPGELVHEVVPGGPAVLGVAQEMDALSGPEEIGRLPLVESRTGGRRGDRAPGARHQAE